VTTISKFSKVAVVAAIITLAFAGGAAHAQDGSPLKIRGGGRLTIANDGRGGVHIRFQASPGAAPEGLRPGQGSWFDRAMNRNEPTIIYDTSGARAAQYVGLLVQSDKYVILRVYNDDQGSLRVTRVGE
jgi:hypothetical protein